jgi:Pyruvate/2-oxoacid:ferredoxin oxidoreductase gamma subunit
MLGALSMATGLITVDSIKQAILYRFPSINIQVNMQAVEQTAASTTSA